jgi:hypothetical protein
MFWNILLSPPSGHPILKDKEYGGDVAREGVKLEN